MATSGRPSNLPGCRVPKLKGGGAGYALAAMCILTPAKYAAPAMHNAPAVHVAMHNAPAGARVDELLAALWHYMPEAPLARRRMASGAIAAGAQLMGGELTPAALEASRSTFRYIVHYFLTGVAAGRLPVASADFGYPLEALEYLRASGFTSQEVWAEVAART